MSCLFLSQVEDCLAHPIDRHQLKHAVQAHRAYKIWESDRSVKR